MKGYRMLVVNAISLLAALLLMFGVEMSAEQQAEIATGMLALINVANMGLRAITTTKVGQSE